MQEAPSPVTTDLSPQMPELAQSFKRALRAANKAPKTLEVYGLAIRRFEEYLRDQGMPLAVDAITREHVEAWITSVLETRKPATASVYY